MAAVTRADSASLTLPCAPMTRDTVIGETRARRATSWRVTAFRLRRRRLFIEGVRARGLAIYGRAGAATASFRAAAVQSMVGRPFPINAGGPVPPLISHRCGLLAVLVINPISSAAAQDSRAVVIEAGPNQIVSVPAPAM